MGDALARENSEIAGVNYMSEAAVLMKWRNQY
jgi:hypothetical protein